MLDGFDSGSINHVAFQIFQCKNVEIADIKKNVPVVADSSVEKVNVNSKNGKREDGQFINEKQKHDGILILVVGHFDFM